MQTDACDELPRTESWGTVALCWAGEVGGEWQATVASGRSIDVGPRRFHHEKVAALPNQPSPD